ncbi:MAG: EAL domain-containing protein, partial [Actinomycetota bacterium]|nr:EAL domain-containing protein [Actinomycetota bacterium]
SILMREVSEAMQILAGLKNLGLSIAVDDFGTGYSSLEYLHRLPIDEVKIDGRFVAGLGVDAERSAIVASVISLAHAMGRAVVAEGVETGAQLERLRSLGCESAQGFFIARPMPADAIADCLAADSIGELLVDGAQTERCRRTEAERTVLIVAADPEVRELATMSLATAGFTVQEAGSGAAALSLARRLRPGCVLIDADAAEIASLEVCRELRADVGTAACTIVMMSALASPTDKAEAFLGGADDYIAKPLAPGDVVTRVRAALRRRETADTRLHDSADSVLLNLLREARAQEMPDTVLTGADKLSGRQTDIVLRLLAGERVRGIAQALYISPSTVRNHLSSIYQKLGVHSQEELLALLHQRALVMS